MMALTRLPSGKRASTIGLVSSTRRPTLLTMRSAPPGALMLPMRLALVLPALLLMPLRPRCRRDMGTYLLMPSSRKRRHGAETAQSIAFFLAARHKPVGWLERSEADRSLEA